MVTTLHSIQIGAALLLTALILIQQPAADAGGLSLGGDSASFMHTRRGAERFLFVLTVILAVVFAAVSLAVVALSK